MNLLFGQFTIFKHLTKLFFLVKYEKTISSLSINAIACVDTYKDTSYEAIKLNV